MRALPVTGLAHGCLRQHHQVALLTPPPDLTLVFEPLQVWLDAADRRIPDLDRRLRRSFRYSLGQVRFVHNRLVPIICLHGLLVTLHCLQTIFILHLCRLYFLASVFLPPPDLDLVPCPLPGLLGTALATAVVVEKVGPLAEAAEAARTPLTLDPIYKS